MFLHIVRNRRLLLLLDPTLRFLTQKPFKKSVLIGNRYDKSFTFPLPPKKTCFKYTLRCSLANINVKKIANHYSLGRRL